MTAAKTATGARAQLIIADPTTKTGKVIGIFNNVSFGLQFDLSPVYILGRHAPVETVYTAQEAVNVSATGFRVVGAGAHVSAKVPYLQDLLNHEYMELALFDRQTNQLTARIHFVRPTGYSTSVSARGVQEISVNFIGLLIDDESGTNIDPGTPDLV